MDEFDDLLFGSSLNERDIEASELNEISQDISDVYLWVLCAFGIPGNVFTIISIYTMGKSSPATFFVLLLASCDGLALIAKLVGHQLFINHVPMGDAGCKLQFIPMFLSTMANWALVLIALERFFSVCYPLKKAYLFTKRRSYILAFIISLTLFVIFAVVIGVLYESDMSGLRCGTKRMYTKFYTSVWYYINATIFLFLPFLLSMGLTLMIIIGLARSRKERRSIFRKDDKTEPTTSGNGQTQSTKTKAQDNNHKLFKETERAERMITIMLILASGLFVVLSLPSCIYRLAHTEKSTDSLTNARWQLFKQCSFVTLDSTHAINFFLYFISAKRFRNHFISLLTCKRWPAKKQHSGTSNESNGTDSTKMSSVAY